MCNMSVYVSNDEFIRIQNCGKFFSRNRKNLYTDLWVILRLYLQCNPLNRILQYLLHEKLTYWFHLHDKNCHWIIRRKNQHTGHTLATSFRIITC